MSSPAHIKGLTPRVEVVAQAEFGSFVRSRKNVIVQLGFGRQPSFPPGIIKYFSAELADVRFGYLDRSTVEAYPIWSRKHFGLAGYPEASAGFYLYDTGRFACFHSGQSKTTLKHDLLTVGVGALFSAMFQSAAPIAASVDLLHDRAAHEVIEAFKAALAKLKFANFADALKPKIVISDPYTMLGVRPTASDEEVRAAYLKKQGANHPDKVAHLDPAIQKLATDRSRAITEAYDTILKRRAKRS